MRRIVTIVVVIAVALWAGTAGVAAAPNGDPPERAGKSQDEPKGDRDATFGGPPRCGGGQLNAEFSAQKQASKHAVKASDCFAGVAPGEGT